MQSKQSANEITQCCSKPHTHKAAMAVNMVTHTAFAGVSVLLYIVHMLHICRGCRSECLKLQK